MCTYFSYCMQSDIMSQHLSSMKGPIKPNFSLLCMFMYGTYFDPVSPPQLVCYVLTSLVKGETWGLAIPSKTFKKFQTAVS